MSMKNIMLAAVVGIAASAGVANANILNGTFNIAIYNFDAVGSSADAVATPANITAKAGSSLGTITYTGLLDFETTGTTPSTIGQFFASGGGVLSNNLLTGLGLNTIISTGSGTNQPAFGLTTLFDIYGTVATAVNGVIGHDDGISLWNGAGYANQVVDSSIPTNPIDTVFNNMAAGPFRLIYSAANGNPEELNMDVTPVPLPAAAWLFGSALVGIGAIGRRNKKA